METTLHQQLKMLYAVAPDSTEIMVEGFRIDAIAQNGELVEIQQASLSALREKTRKLLPPRGRRKLRIVKPIVTRRRITFLDRPEGSVVRSRMSPKSCDWMDLFMDLVHFCTVFPRKRLTLEVVMIEAEETRIDRPPRRRRSKPYKTLDIRLTRVGDSIEFQSIRDLMAQLPIERLPSTFDTSELARVLDRPRWFAQKVAYSLRTMGAIETVSRRRNARQYRITPRLASSLRNGAHPKAVA